MRLLDIDDSVIAELVVGMLAARHVAAFARASSHCAELAKRALQFDGRCVWLRAVESTSFASAGQS